MNATNKADTDTLWNMKAGDQATLTGFDSSLSEEYEQRVVTLGFRPEARIKCLRTSALGAPKVYQVSNSVFSLEDNIASKIFVIPFSE